MRVNRESGGLFPFFGLSRIFSIFFQFLIGFFNFFAIFFNLFQSFSIIFNYFQLFSIFWLFIAISSRKIGGPGGAISGYFDQNRGLLEGPEGYKWSFGPQFRPFIGFEGHFGNFLQL